MGIFGCRGRKHESGTRAKAGVRFLAGHTLGGRKPKGATSERHTNTVSIVRDSCQGKNPETAGSAGRLGTSVTGRT